MVKAYWLIGQDVVEEEQHGQSRANYGDALLKQLSTRLTKKYGRGFSVSTLKDIRQFYLVYANANQISHAVRGQSLFAISSSLSWTHYRALMRITRTEARAFYETEAIKNHWSGRELDRQIGSLLFDRLAKSRDKEGLIKLAGEGQEIMTPADAIKDPLILEFLGLPEHHRLVESKLEEALIDHLEKFLREMGKGFAFVARQRRITLDGDHFYCDLVMYHYILKCFVIVDIKNHAVTHGDLGQMQFYVNYYDREIKMENDNPTIGLILCTKKNKKMVQYTLGEKSEQIFASRYQFHLPSEAELEAELKKELAELKAEKPADKQLPHITKMRKLAKSSGLSKQDLSRAIKAVRKK